MNDPLEEAASVMREASVQLDAVSDVMNRLEAQQQEFIQMVNQVLDYADRLEIERNFWRFRAEEMEKGLRDARRQNAELGAKTGEHRCPECGSKAIALVRNEDQMWLDCQECGHREETP